VGLAKASVVYGIEPDAEAAHGGGFPRADFAGQQARAVMLHQKLEPSREERLKASASTLSRARLWQLQHRSHAA
jgi:hypothetical protein